MLRGQRDNKELLYDELTREIFTIEVWFLTRFLVKDKPMIGSGKLARMKDNDVKINIIFLFVFLHIWQSKTKHSNII